LAATATKRHEKNKNILHATAQMPMYSVPLFRLNV